MTNFEDIGSRVRLPKIQATERTVGDSLGDSSLKLGVHVNNKKHFRVVKSSVFK